MKNKNGQMILGNNTNGQLNNKNGQMKITQIFEWSNE